MSISEEFYQNIHHIAHALERDTIFFLLEPGCLFFFLLFFLPNRFFLKFGLFFFRSLRWFQFSLSRGLFLFGLTACPLNCSSSLTSSISTVASVSGLSSC